MAACQGSHRSPYGKHRDCTGPVFVDTNVIQDSSSISWWDALIVGAAQACECRVLLTEDLQHDREFDGMRVVNPFSLQDRTPEEVLDALSS